MLTFGGGNALARKLDIVPRGLEVVRVEVERRAHSPFVLEERFAKRL
jgi:hypothetical protein